MKKNLGFIYEYESYNKRNLNEKYVNLGFTLDHLRYMNEIEEIKQQIKNLLVKDIDSALQGLESKIKPNSNAYDDLIVLQARLNKMRRSEVQGILKVDEIDINCNRLTKSIIDYVNNLGKEDFSGLDSKISEVIKPKSIFKEKEFYSQIDIPTDDSSELSIENYFQTDLRNVPNESFEKLQNKKNTAGENVFYYRKELDNSEFGIFNVVEVNLIAGRTRNIIFYNYKPNVVNPNKLKKLINGLYRIMGEDDDGKMGFVPEDLEDYNSESSYILFGRNWREYPKHNNPVALVRFEDHISLGIWGIKI